MNIDSNLPLTAVFVLLIISLSGFLLHAAYKSITVNLTENHLLVKLRRLTFFVALIGMFTLCVGVYDFAFGNDYLGRTPIFIFAATLAINLILLVSTVFNRQCRYRITYFAKHPNTTKMIGLLLVLLSMIWVILKFVANFFFKGNKDLVKFGDKGNRQGPHGNYGYLSYEEDAKRTHGEKF